MRRSPRVESAALRRCGRRSRHRVDCTFVARGRSGTLRTACRLRVVVRGEGTDASARLASARCRSKQVLVLTYARARAALQSEANRLAGKPVALVDVSRLDAQAFGARAEWSRTRTGTADECSAELVAELLQSSSLRLRTTRLACRSLPASS